MNLKNTFCSLLFAAAMLLPFTAFTQTTINIATLNANDGGTGWWMSPDGILVVGNGANGLVITGTITNGSRRIEVALNETASVTIRDLSISGMPSNNDAVFQSNCPLWLNGGSTLNLTIEGTNTLTAGAFAPGIRCEDSYLNITAASTGRLTATGGDYGAGIGGRTHLSAGNITISGGTVNATGGPTGAGIGGGGNGGGGGNIIINGGTVNATGSGGGGLNGAGIGAGGGTGGGATGTFTFNGNGVVFTTSVSDGDENHRTGGIIFGSAVGIFYGTTVTPTNNFTIPTGYSLTVPSGKTLTIAATVTLTNNGAVTPANNSTINVAGTVAGNKIAGASVSTPTLSSKTDNSITLNAATLMATTGQTVEYAINTTNSTSGLVWQDSPAFSNLTLFTSYFKRKR